MFSLNPSPAPPSKFSDHKNIFFFASLIKTCKYLQSFSRFVWKIFHLANTIFTMYTGMAGDRLFCGGGGGLGVMGGGVVGKNHLFPFKVKKNDERISLRMMGEGENIVITVILKTVYSLFCLLAGVVV